MASMSTRYSRNAPLRKEVERLAECGMTAREIAIATGINKSNVKYWYKQYKSGLTIR